MKLEPMATIDARCEVKDAWCVVTSARSGAPEDIQLAVEIDCPEGATIDIIGAVRSRNQIVVNLKVKKPNG